MRSIGGAALLVLAFGCGSSEDEASPSDGGAGSGGGGVGGAGGVGAGGSSGAGGTGNAATGGAGGASNGGSSGSAGSSGAPSVPPVLHVDFDSSPLGAYVQASFDADWPSSQWESGLGTGRAEIIDGADAYMGRSLRVKYPSGTYGPGDNAIQFWIDLPKSYDELFVAYRVRFGTGFDFVKGGKLPGLLGGTGNTGGEKPTGSDGWSARMMWRSGGELVQYVYHVDQPTIYGEDFFWSIGGQKSFVPGTWHGVEHRIVMNTPGQNDGIVQGFWDGVLAVDRKDVRFRDVDSFAIDAFYFSTFFGGGDASWAASKDEWVYFDEFVVSTVPITH